MRRGFSLLEIILSLAILTGALVVLGEVARHAADSAHIAQDLSQAQLLCESKLGEIISGVSPPESDDEQLQADNDDSPLWSCSVDVEPVNNQTVQNLLAVTVTVTQNVPNETNPVTCTLTRWMTDPNATYSGGSSSNTSTSSSGSTSNNTSN
jgi:prepilin-type N-terminal cleavage/methylation domain-containing protein